MIWKKATSLNKWTCKKSKVRNQEQAGKRLLYSHTVN